MPTTFSPKSAKNYSNFLKDMGQPVVEPGPPLLWRAGKKRSRRFLFLRCSPANAESTFGLTMTLKARASVSSDASASTTIRNRSPNATPVPPATRMSTSIPGSVSSRRISARASVAGSTRVSSLPLKTLQTVQQPPKNETPPRTRVVSMTPSRKTPQTLSRSPSSSSVKSPSISVTTPSPQTNRKLSSSFSVTSPPSVFSLNTENQSTTTPSKPKSSLSSTVKTPTPKRVIQHPNTPGSKTGSPAHKNSLGRKSGSATALLVDDGSLVLSRQPKTTALTSSNGTGTVVATDDDWLSGVGAGRGSGDAFWEADDMSLEMLTDINDGDVDEEVSSSFPLPFSPPFKPSNLPTFFADGILTNVHPIPTHP